MAVEPKQPEDSETDCATGAAPQAAPRELSLRAIILGALLGMVFGASSLYLVLKVGLTVSASIPVAVISLALFRLWSKAGGRDATHPREQHRPDRRLGGRVHRLRAGRDHAGDHDSWASTSRSPG